MSLITASNLAKSYGALDIFHNVSFALAPGARVGLVGPNGVGKTTLLHILTGAERPSDGVFHVASGARVGFLPQDVAMQDERSLPDFVLDGLGELTEVRRELRRREREMASGSDKAAWRRYARCQERFEALGGYELDWKLEQTLRGLGFREEELEMPLSLLSGGQHTRAYLARLLLQEPDILLLDEPTNHLDMAAMAWLERALANWKGGILAVSHDRFFLDAVVKEIWELSASGLRQYPGNYSAYRAQQAHHLKTQKEQYRNQQKEIRRHEEFIKRYQGGGWRIGEVHRRQQLLEDMERVERPRSGPDMALAFRGKARSLAFVLEGDDLAVGYVPERPLFAVKRLEAVTRDRIAILGANGCGKTTLLRVIAGQLPALAGRLRLNPGARIAHLTQTPIFLDQERTVLEEMMSTGFALPAPARHYLARFLFTGDDAFKKISHLSGGEKKRLTLAKMTLSEDNLLLLDEPTNHLDTMSREALEEALEEYGGTVLFVSHDRYLINRLATKLWVIENGRLAEIKGNYEAYLALQERESEQRQAKPSLPGPAPARATPARPQKVALEESRVLEEEIAALEVRLGQVEQALVRASESGAAAELESLGRKHKQVSETLERAYEKWHEISERGA